MNKNAIIQLTMSLVILLTSCERIALDEPVQVKIGQKIRVDADLSFTIDSLNDFRCPLLVECIWAGDVKVLISFTESFHRIDTSIYRNDRHQNPVEIGGYSFRVTGVNPQSQKGEIIDQTRYTVEMVVSRN